MIDKTILRIIENTRFVSKKDIDLFKIHVFNHNHILIGSVHSLKLTSIKRKKIENIIKRTVFSLEKPTIVIENKIPSHVSKHQMIREFRESGILKAFSEGNKLPIKSIEPNRKDLISFLKEMGYSLNEIAEWAGRNLLGRVSSTNLVEVKKIKNKIRRDFKLDIDMCSLIESQPKEKILKINTDINIAREYFLYRNLIELMKKHNIFTIYGMHHYLTLKKLLKKRS